MGVCLMQTGALDRGEKLPEYSLRFLSTQRDDPLSSLAACQIWLSFLKKRTVLEEAQKIQAEMQTILHG